MAVGENKAPIRGVDAVSIMRVVDTRNSDPGLAGLSFACQGDGTISAIVILVQPMSPGSRPRVSLRSGASDALEVEATVGPTGRSLSLPLPARELAIKDWQQAAELDVEIGKRETSMRGTVPVGGLAAAFRLLNSSCPRH